MCRCLQSQFNTIIIHYNPSQSKCHISITSMGSILAWSLSLWKGSGMFLLLYRCCTYESMYHWIKSVAATHFTQACQDSAAYDHIRRFSQRSCTRQFWDKIYYSKQVVNFSIRGLYRSLSLSMDDPVLPWFNIHQWYLQQNTRGDILLDSILSRWSSFLEYGSSLKDYAPALIILVQVTLFWFECCIIDVDIIHEKLYSSTMSCGIFLLWLQIILHL